MPEPGSNEFLDLDYLFPGNNHPAPPEPLNQARRPSNPGQTGNHLTGFNNGTQPFGVSDSVANNFMSHSQPFQAQTIEAYQNPSFNTNGPKNKRARSFESQEVLIKEEDTEKDKKLKRRKQIAEASRMSRARRKRELEDLRDENEKLRDERSQFLAKISELQTRVEHLKSLTSSELQVENELLKAQLDQHKSFVNQFRQLSNEAPTAENAKSSIFKQAIETAHARVQGIIASSQTGEWKQATIPVNSGLPFQNFSIYYNLKQVGNNENPAATPEEILEIRIDFLFEGIDPGVASEKMWHLFGQSSQVKNLFAFDHLEVTPIKDIQLDTGYLEDSQVLYYKQRGKTETDLTMVMNKQRKNLALSTLALPNTHPSKLPVGKVSTVSMIGTTTDNIVGPILENPRSDRRTIVYGFVVWSSGTNCRVCLCYYLPDNVNLLGIANHSSLINLPEGSITPHLARIINQYKCVMEARI
eukprot:maker-scaffold_2-snap-gene-25.58-mRNA-1 protein AED:0.01 eAED:0.01 QI:159/1/1/1/1/1/5/221/470